MWHGFPIIFLFTGCPKKVYKNPLFSKRDLAVHGKQQKKFHYYIFHFFDLFIDFLGHPVNKEIVETPPTFMNKTKKILPRKIWCCVDTVSHTNEQKSDTVLGQYAISSYSTICILELFYQVQKNWMFSQLSPVVEW